MKSKSLIKVSSPEPYSLETSRPLEKGRDILFITYFWGRLKSGYAEDVV